jgi:hypothetical protein
MGFSVSVFAHLLVETIIHLDRDDWDKDFFVGRTIEKTYEKEKEYYRHAYEAAGVGAR